MKTNPILEYQVTFSNGKVEYLYSGNGIKDIYAISITFALRNAWPTIIDRVLCTDNNIEYTNFELKYQTTTK